MPVRLADSIAILAAASKFCAGNFCAPLSASSRKDVESEQRTLGVGVLMVIAQKDGFIFVILSDGEFLPERFDRPSVAVFRQGDSTDRQLLALKKPGERTPPELLAPPAELICSYSEGGPLHQHTDGSWWYYDETWTYENGPFETEEAGADSLQEYCETVLAERKPDDPTNEETPVTNPS